MSDPALCKKIMDVLIEQRIIEVCTYRELRTTFGIPDNTSNRQFNRALGRLCKDRKLHVYRDDERADRGHADYRLYIVSLSRIDKAVLAKKYDRLYRRREDTMRRSRLALV